METHLQHAHTWYQLKPEQVTDLLPLIPAMVLLGLAKRAADERFESLISSFILLVH